MNLGKEYQWAIFSQLKPMYCQRLVKIWNELVTYLSNSICKDIDEKVKVTYGLNADNNLHLCRK